MAHSKSEQFLKPEIQLADYARAIAHPARIAILKILADRGTCMCGEVVIELPLAQATVSQHLKALKQAGLIDGEVEGPRVCYCISPDGLKAFEQATQSFFTQLQHSSIPTPEEEGA